MNTRNDGALLTRRGLLQRAAGLWASITLLSPMSSRRAAARLVSRRDATPPSEAPLGRIALEEHFVIPETFAASRGAPGGPDFQRRLTDIGSARIAEMDRGALDVCVLSLTADGIQGIRQVSEAIRIARR